MRVLLAGAEWHGDILGACERALHAGGMEVGVVATNDASDRVQRLRAAGDTLRRLPLVGTSCWTRLDRHARARLNRDVHTVMRHAFETWRPDVLLALVDGVYPVFPDLLDGFPRVHKIAWMMDDPFYHSSTVSFDLHAFDILYTVEDSLVTPLEQATSRPVACVPLAADADTYRVLAPAEREAERHALVFVGKSYRDMPAGVPRQEVLRHIADLDLAIWGDAAWRTWKTNDVDLGRCYKGGPVPPDKTNKIYNSADAVVNIHHPQIRCGTSLRTFSICAAGAFQLVDWRPGVDDMLEPGKEIVTFRCGVELAENARRYLRDAPARQRIAAAGERRVRAEHTYAHRLKRIMRDVDARFARSG
jgi:hypothetical protein